MTTGAQGVAWQLAGVGVANRLSGVELAVDFAEVLALVGANGSGKTTLLSVLAGDVPPTTGELRFEAASFAGLPVAERARRRAVLVQHAADPVPLPARAVLELAGVPWGEPALPARELRTALEVDALLDRPLDQLAGGERQRVQIARVLGQVWRRPRTAILLDEPCNHLDVRHQQRLAVLLRQAAALGHAVVVAAHDLAFALATADRVALLEAGRVVSLPAAAALADEALLTRVFGTAIPLHRVAGRAVVDVFAGVASAAAAPLSPDER